MFSNLSLTFSWLALIVSTLAAPLEESGQRIEDICGHPRRRGRQLLEGLGKLLSGLLGVGDYEDYDNDPLADNIALSLYGEWPWQVSVREFDGLGYIHKCGGAVIRAAWVVTAAHCLLRTPPEDLVLEFGEWDMDDIELEVEPSQTRTVDFYVMHPDYDEISFDNDLALLHLNESVEWRDNVRPICLPDSEDGNHQGKIGWITGWGRLFSGGPFPPILKEIDLPIMSNQECEAEFLRSGYWENIPDHFLCAGYGDGRKDTCEGDSGGPLVVVEEDQDRYQLAGVLSWGIGCSEPHQPGVYTRVSKFINWIESVVRE